MDPDELTLQIARLMTQLPAVAHAEFLEREVTYWRAEATILRKQLAEIESRTHLAVVEPHPPEPPIGTQFHDAMGVRQFFRGDLGWYCGGDDDNANCPCDWAEASELIGTTYRRTLPGMPPTPAPKEGP